MNLNEQEIVSLIRTAEKELNAALNELGDSEFPIKVSIDIQNMVSEDMRRGYTKVEITLTKIL